MTIVLMVMVVLPIMSAVVTSIKASSMARDQAQVETALINAADRVNRAPRGCDYAQFAKAALQTQKWPSANASVVEQHFVIPGAIPSDPSGGWRNGACAAGTTIGQLEVQLITVTVTSPSGKIHRSMQVVKSDV